jgi:hypothetical protein
MNFDTPDHLLLNTDAAGSSSNDFTYQPVGDGSNAPAFLPTFLPNSGDYSGTANNDPANFAAFQFAAAQQWPISGEMGPAFSNFAAAQQMMFSSAISAATQQQYSGLHIGQGKVNLVIKY